MNAHIGELEAAADENTNYLHVIFTAPLVQLAVMCLRPGEQIPTESPAGAFRFFRVQSGEAKFVFDHSDEERTVRDGERVVVPHGVSHRVMNASKTALLKLYTIISPPSHPDETVHRTKANADAAERARTGRGTRFLPVE
ncbi:MAG: cupin domain-containing protein [Candidatus Eisenbacteria bacterium]